MGLFDKKFCSICGEKIGLLGNRKLDDGNLCKECANKLSPWFSDRRQSTVEQIKEQLEYREKNKEDVEAFSVTRTLGENYKILIDDSKGKFIVTSQSNYKNGNPDVIDLTMITGCETSVNENRHEEMRRDKDGHMVSFNPPRYSYSYDFYVTLYLNHPYFDDIEFKYNSSSVNEGGHMGPGGRHSAEYDSYVKKIDELKAVIDGLRDSVREEAIEKAKPRTQVTCIHCGAVTLPDENGLCEYCGLPALK